MKLKGASWLNPFAPTTTVTGTVTLPPDDWKSSWPLKFPATSPLPGRAEFTTFTVTVDGAVPVFDETASQAPPSAVVGTSVHFSAPEPAARICRAWDGGLVVLGGKE